MEARRVAAGNGWQWISSGLSLFKASPVIWIALFIIYLLIGMGLSIVPVIGPVVLNLLAPVFIAGFMLGCRAIEMGEELEINHLFAGFKQNTAQLITVGGIYFAGIIVIAGFVVLTVGGAALSSIIAGGKADTLAAGQTMLLPLLIMMALMLPLFMAYWFAPTLVVFHDIKALDAMKLSFSACLANVIPFTVYSFILLVIMMLATSVFVMASAISWVIGAILGLAWLSVMIPTMTASLYVSYKDIFDIQLGQQQEAVEA